MDKTWVCNASPIILLSKVHALHLLTDLSGKIYVPERVGKEVLVKAGKEIKDFLKVQKVRVIKANVEPEIMEWGLGIGESQVLSVVLNNPTYESILDDKLARKCARAFSLKIKGTLGIIILAKRKGILKDALPLINELIARGIYIEKNLLADIKTFVQEK